MKLNIIHIEELDKESYPPGSGWVRSTWEKGLSQTAQEEISQLINSEKSSCPKLEPPIICVGEREDKLLHEIEEESYNLFIEGMLHSFNSLNFHKKVQSKLYSYAPCPIILVKNLGDLNKVALLVGDNMDLQPLLSTFLNIFENSEMTVDLIHYTIQKSGKSGIREKMAHGETVLRDARTMLAEKGGDSTEGWIVQDTPENIGDFLGAYGLVAARIPSHAGKKSRVIELLGQVPSATLLCRR